MTQNVLVPHDLTEFSDAGLEAAARLGAVGRLHVVHVLPRLDLTHPTVVWPVQEDEPRRKHAHGALEARLRGTPYAQAQLHVAIGDPGSRIVELARQIAADLVVMPTHGRTGLERLVLGSVAEHVVRFAPCPVLVLPAAAIRPLGAGPDPSQPDASRDDQVEALAVEILGQVQRKPGLFLTAARIGIPMGEDTEWWEDALGQRLLARGVEFVDLVFAPGARTAPLILDLRFEERFA